eukprot:TRINITY_DN20442_c0_g1_i1.p1 TRINITY_DN20442_c0_g1~~TRINITY_DN20442_c0_g1_i1.p1  ORF type:complete len:772 (-),score=127.74 TRINITY_DN20442_c0_g1_i1:1312-3594(-)
MALWEVHARSVILLNSLWAVRQVLSFCDPFFVNRLITYAGDESASVAYGLLLAACFFLSRLTYISVENNGIIFQETLGQKMKTSLVAVVFRKTLLLRQDSFLSFSTGKMNNMITTDVDKTKQFMNYSDGLVTAPLRFIIAATALHAFFGSALWLALAFMILFGFVNQPFMQKSSKLNTDLQKKTDERVRLVGETLSAIEIVKCYAWEEAARKKVEDARKLELDGLWRVNLVNTGLEAVNTSIMPLTLLCLFASYTLLYPDHPLTAAQTFTAVNLMEMLQGVFQQIPWIVTNLIEAKVASKRLQHLLLLPETTLPSTAELPSYCILPPRALPLNEDMESLAVSSASDKNYAVSLVETCYAWPPRAKQDDEEELPAPRCCSRAWWGALLGNPSQEEQDAELGTCAMESGQTKWTASFKLQIGKDSEGFNIPAKSLVAIVGSTSSGKSSILQAVLGEMPSVGTSCVAKVNHSEPIGFVPQHSWIINGTARDNILFGAPYNAKKYDETVQCCDLVSDFDKLSNRDLTLVGEKGVGLSGGQKARLCLARAVYRRGDCSLFLLDDPYSALDAHVAQRIHSEVVCKMLKSCTRLVATNRLEFVSSCDIVVVVEDGKIQGMGSYEMLRSSCTALQRLLKIKQDDMQNMQAPALQRSSSDPYESSATAQTIPRPPCLERTRSEGTSQDPTNFVRQSSGDSCSGLPVMRQALSAGSDGSHLDHLNDDAVAVTNAVMTTEGPAQGVDEEFRASGTVSKQVLHALVAELLDF